MNARVEFRHNICFSEGKTTIHDDSRAHECDPSDSGANTRQVHLAKITPISRDYRFMALLCIASGLIYENILQNPLEIISRQLMKLSGRHILLQLLIRRYLGAGNL